MAQSSSFDTYFAELDTSKMISTSATNYAICDHGYPSNWRTASVNKDEVTITTHTNQTLIKQWSQLSTNESAYLNKVHNTMSSIVRLGPFSVKSTSGLVKLTTFDRYGGSSTMGTGGGGGGSSSSGGATSSSSSTSSGMAIAGGAIASGAGTSSSSTTTSSGGSMSMSRIGPNSYIISKQDFPFNWRRVFLLEDVATIVYKNGRVIMSPVVLLQPNERQAMHKLRDEVEQSSKASQAFAQSFNSFKNPMDFVSKAFGGMFG